MGIMDFFKKGVEKPVETKKPMDFGSSVKTAETLPASYTIKGGDSLSLIAKKYYGDAQKWNIIYEANKSQIKDPNKIFPGTTITIPKI